MGAITSLQRGIPCEDAEATAEVLPHHTAATGCAATAADAGEADGAAGVYGAGDVEYEG